MFALLLVFTPAISFAHAVGLSQGTYTSSAATIDAELTFTRAEVAAASSSSTDDGIAAWVASRIEVSGCTLEKRDGSPAERDGLTVHAQWRCPGKASTASVNLGFLSELPAGHRHLAGNQVLHAGAPRLALTATPHADFPGAIRLGIEHILTGFDHLLFLFGMVLVAARTRAVLKVVTAFTVAHSLTLALGALGLFAPSPRWVEPLIALSIAYVGIENLIAKDLDKRWRVAFAFGLLHGFGFSGALSDIGTSASQLPLMLLGFNLGVEAGQLAVLAVLLPVLALLRRSKGLWLHLKPALSALVVVPGLIWFVVRVSGS